MIPITLMEMLDNGNINQLIHIHYPNYYCNCNHSFLIVYLSNDPAKKANIINNIP